MLNMTMPADMALRCSAYQFNSNEWKASCKTCWSAAQT
jgi:hypothetical protein